MKQPLLESDDFESIRDYAVQQFCKKFKAIGAIIDTNQESVLLTFPDERITSKASKSGLINLIKKFYSELLKPLKSLGFQETKIYKEGRLISLVTNHLLSVKVSISIQQGMFKCKISHHFDEQIEFYTKYNLSTLLFTDYCNEFLKAADILIKSLRLLDLNKIK